MHRARPIPSFGVVFAAPCHCPLSPRTDCQHFQATHSCTPGPTNPDSHHAAWPALSVICPPLLLALHAQYLSARQAAPCCTMHHSEGCLGAPSLFRTATCPTQTKCLPHANLPISLPVPQAAPRCPVVDRLIAHPATRLLLCCSPRNARTVPTLASSASLHGFCAPLYYPKPYLSPHLPPAAVNRL